jgi:hypothetical protein
MAIIESMTPDTHVFGIQNSAEEVGHESDYSGPCTAELAECTCPEFCERDHDND